MELIVELLTAVYNLLLKTASVPEGWSYSNLKKRLQRGTRNYRPVSLTSVPGKLVATIVKSKRIVHYVDEQDSLGEKSVRLF